MRSSRRYGRQIPETPEEVIHHALWTADPERLGRWLEEEFGPGAAAELWSRACALCDVHEAARGLGLE